MSSAGFRQIRSRGAAGKLASSCKGSAAQESRSLRYAQVAQGRTLTASLTEQGKFNDLEHQIDIWCSRSSRPQVL